MIQEHPIVALVASRCYKGIYACDTATHEHPIVALVVLVKLVQKFMLIFCSLSVHVRLSVPKILVSDNIKAWRSKCGQLKTALTSMN